MPSWHLRGTCPRLARALPGSWTARLRRRRADLVSGQVALVLAAALWLSGSMTVLVTRRHVDYVRVTTMRCPAVS